MGSVCETPSTEQALLTNGRKAGQSARDKDFRKMASFRKPPESYFDGSLSVVRLKNVAGVGILSVGNVY